MEGKIIVMLILHVDDMLVGVEKDDPTVQELPPELKKRAFTLGNGRSCKLANPEDKMTPSEARGLLGALQWQVKVLLELKPCGSRSRRRSTSW